MNTLEFIAKFSWVVLAAVGLLCFRKDISHALRAGTLLIELFGLKIATTRQEMAEILDENSSFFRPTEAHWNYLVRLAKAPEQTLAREPGEQPDLDLLRPLRNASLIAGEEDESLRKSRQIRLTPLGRFILKHRNSSAQKSD